MVIVRSIYEKKMSTNEQPGPTNYEDLYKAAERELQSDNYEEAENLFAKALDLNNTCIEAWIGLANLHIKTEKFDKAQNDADKAIDIHRRKGLSAESTGHPIAVAFLKGMVFLCVCKHKEGLRTLDETK